MMMMSDQPLAQGCNHIPRTEKAEVFKKKKRTENRDDLIQIHSYTHNQILRASSLFLLHASCDQAALGVLRVWKACEVNGE